MPNTFVDQSLKKQDDAQKIAEEKCITRFGKNVLNIPSSAIYNNTTESYFCPAYWDTVICWPNTAAGSVAVQSCPSEVIGFRGTHNATRLCLPTGEWYYSESQETYWANYTACWTKKTATQFLDFNHNETDFLENYKTYIPIVNYVSKTGYTISLITLITALIIMLSTKKLYCARNILHMHLFASFILRAFTYLLIKLSFVNNLGLLSDLIDRNGDCYYTTNTETNNWSCKLMTSIWQYSITANYSWILMEGLYLHNLIFRALFADSNSIKRYVILGWGIPLIIIAHWIVLRLKKEDTYCWTTHNNFYIYQIIEIPTIISILINLILFTRISILLFKKLRLNAIPDDQSYQKWVKSTLVLVPLFGVHYAPFLILYYSNERNSVMNVVWLMCDQLFGSFQGFFVAILYCFLNGEVKTELKPILYGFVGFMTTNKCSKCLFPSRNKLFRSAVVRNSVCTTMSCSSLYTNGVLQRSKCRLNSLPKLKPYVDDKFKRPSNEPICKDGSKSLQELTGHKSQRKSQNFNLSINGLAETSFCLDHNAYGSPLQAVKVDEEETLKMIVQNE